MLINRSQATFPYGPPWSAFKFLGQGGACVIAPPGASLAYWAVTAGHAAPPVSSAFTRVFSAYNNTTYLPYSYDFAIMRLPAPTTNFVPLAASPPVAGETLYAMAKGYYGLGDLDTGPLTQGSTQVEALGTNVIVSGTLTDVLFKVNLSNTTSDFQACLYDSGSPIFVSRNSRLEHCGVVVSSSSGQNPAYAGATTYINRTDLLASKFSLFRHRVTGDWDDDGAVGVADFNVLVARPDFLISHFNLLLSCWGDGGGSPMTEAAETELRRLANLQVVNVRTNYEPAALS